MNWASLKFSSATLCLPLFLPMVLTIAPDNCAIRSVVYPRNREFLDLCGEEPNAPVAAKNANHPCFKLETGDLHNIQLFSYPGEHGDFPDKNVIIKDGNLTHFTFLNAAETIRLNWNEAGIALNYKPHPRFKHSCYELRLSVWQNLGWRMYIKEEKGDEIVADTEATRDGTATVCTKWATISLERIPNYIPDVRDQRN